MEPADPDDVAAADDGEVAGTVQLADGSELPVTLDAGLVEQARDAGVDVERLRAAATPTAGTVDLRAQTDGDTSATIPVQDYRKTDLTSRFRRDRDYQFIQDDQIKRLISNSVNYTERVGHFLLERDDLIPTVKERLKALITGEDGIEPEPADPNSDADQRLADHMEEVYERDVKPGEVIDAILRENMMNARAVLRSTDLAELDLRELDYLKDGITGEEIYIQDQTTVYTFDVDDGDDTGLVPGIELGQETLDAQPLVIGEHVFDISLYDSPPLEAVADTAVNKMVLQRLKARKAEITSFGAVYAKVEPPSYLPEDDYFDRVQDDDWDGEGEPPTKLERAMQQNIQNAFDTLKDFQSGTVMSVPDFWTLEQLDIPETDDPIDDQIRGYNRDISRRLLVPLDLIELQSGSELSRETMFATLMTTIAGWRREIKRIFDQFAETEAEIEGISGDVDHTFPPLKDANSKQVISALQYAGIGGLSEKEVRQMMNTVQGVDLETDQETLDDGQDVQPPAGGPDDPGERTQQMEQMLDDQRRGQPPGQQDAQAGQQGPKPGERTGMAQTLRGAAASAQVAADDVDGDVDFTLDFPVAQRPNVPSRVSIASVQQVTGGRLALPPVPKRDIQADTLEARIRDIIWDLVDGAEADAFQPRVADRPPNHQPFIDITGDVDADVVESLADALPDAYMTLFDSLEASLAGDSGNGRRAGGAGGRLAGQDGSDGPTGRAADILRSVPFLPNPDDGPVQINAGDLKAWLAWVRADRPPLEGAWNPAAHPRGPDGQFIERPYDIPDEVASDIDDLSTPDVLDRLVREGELSDGDLEALLGDDGVRIDGVPADAQTRDDLQQIDQDGSGSPQEAMEAAGWTSDADDIPDLRVDSADDVEPILEASEGSPGSAAQNMSVATFDDGRQAYIKRFRDDVDGDREDGEKPTLAERDRAADQFLRNLGFDDHLPPMFWNQEEQYMASHGVDGDSARGTPAPAGADQIDEDEFKDFAAATMLVGNSDLHGDNWRVRDDGTFSAIDLNKSGGDFTTGGKFRERGTNMIMNVSSKLGIDWSKDDLAERAGELARDLDVDQALDGVPNSDISDADRHQFRDNIQANIEAFAGGDVSL